MVAGLSLDLALSRDARRRRARRRHRRGSPMVAGLGAHLVRVDAGRRWLGCTCRRLWSRRVVVGLSLDITSIVGVNTRPGSRRAGLRGRRLVVSLCLDVALGPVPVVITWVVAPGLCGHVTRAGARSRRHCPKGPVAAGDDVAKHENGQERADQKRCAVGRECLRNLVRLPLPLSRFVSASVVPAHVDELPAR